MSNEANETLRAATARNEAKRDLGLAEFGIRAAHPQIASRRQFEAGAQGVAIDGGDDGLGKSLDDAVDVGRLEEVALLIGTAGQQFVEVGARRESRPFASDDDGTNRRVVGGFLQALDEFRTQRGAESVSRVGPVEQEDAHATFVAFKNKCQGNTRSLGVPSLQS